ncbi:unnamed protein product [Caenorhabditis nigoni]
MVLEYFLTIFILSLFSWASSDNCSSCVSSGNIWCVESAQCNTTFSSCQTDITVQLNCPTSPKYAYDDNFMRTQHLTFASASHGDQIQKCFDNQIPTMKLFKLRAVPCSEGNPNITCRGFTAYDVTQKVIVVSFRGSSGTDQSEQLNNGFINDGIQWYPDINGNIFKVIYDSFMFLWNGGIQQDLRSLKYKYPGFVLWINGHSLGGMLSWVASSYLVTSGLYKAEDIKVVAFGSPRLGDYDFAVWYTNTFLYSFHIIHRADFPSRQLRIDPHTNTTVLYHPRTQVWYNNYMNETDPYEICEQADGDYCSDTVQEGLSMWDHIYYFNVNMPAWGRDGCPKDRSSYAQQ